MCGRIFSFLLGLFLPWSVLPGRIEINFFYELSFVFVDSLNCMFKLPLLLPFPFFYTLSLIFLFVLTPLDRNLYPWFSTFPIFHISLLVFKLLFMYSFISKKFWYVIVRSTLIQWSFRNVLLNSHNMRVFFKLYF